MTDQHAGHNPSSAPEPLPAPASVQHVAPVRVEGLAETFEEVRYELKLIAHASKYDWVNKRLIVLRNAVIAFAVLAGVMVVLTMCYREAYRQTLNIAAFDVPEQMKEHGVNGEIVAKALFDELIKRRKTVTTLDAGELKEAWTEHRSEVAIPQTHFTLQAVFSYLRHLTGNEIAVDGEMFVDGESVTVRARVAGNPPVTVSGPLGQWEALMGGVADYVYEATQPAVLASYRGLTATTPQNLAALSKLVVKMTNASPRLPPNAIAVAYDAYGGALMRQDRLREALAAFNTALRYDPALGLAVMNAAEVNFRLDNRKTADRLYIQAANMPIAESVKRGALRRRVSLALNSLDCKTAASALRDLKNFARYDELWEQWSEARYLVNCGYAEEQGAAIARNIALLHPDAANAWVYLSAVLTERPGVRHLREGADAARQAIAKSADPHDILNYFAHTNLISALAGLGEGPEAERVYQETRAIMPTDRPDFTRLKAAVMYANGDYAGVEREAGRRLQAAPGSSMEGYHWLALALEKLQKTDEAIRLLRQGQHYSPRRCILFDDAGNVLARSHRIAEALAEFERGTAAEPKCGQPYISAARALVSVKRLAEAKAKLNALIVLAPRSDGASEARALLATWSAAAKPDVGVAQR